MGQCRGLRRCRSGCSEDPRTLVEPRSIHGVLKSGAAKRRARKAGDSSAIVKGGSGGEPLSSGECYFACIALRIVLTTVFILEFLRHILHDPKIYDVPFTFNSDRFIKDGELDTNVFDPHAVAFGYGRR